MIMSLAINGLFNDMIKVFSSGTNSVAFANDYHRGCIGLLAMMVKVMGDILDLAKARKICRNVLDT